MATARTDDDALIEHRIAQARARIRRNFPSETAPLHWRKDSGNRLVSTCGRFAIERHGEGEKARYTAKLQPHSVIGVSLGTAEQAKEVCNRHASPLPLEPPAEREPGSDDE
jgi:hypothetical protein